MGIIEQLIDGARRGVEERRGALPQEALEARLGERGEGRPFNEALTRPGLSLIAEFKRRSPSLGDIAADAVLLIVRALGDRDLRDLHERARALDLDCLVEVHDARELERALEAGAEVIGINNRDLDQQQITLATTFELMPDVPAGKTVVAESGISGREQLEELERVGVDAVLIGGALMNATDPEAKTRELTGADEGTREHLF